MQRRDFGSFSYNHMPPGGYRHGRPPLPEVPQYYSEQNNRPQPFKGGDYPIVEAELFIPDVETVHNVPENGFEIQLGDPELPVQQRREHIKQAVENNSVTIVVSETGGGKSTQTPQILLEDGWSKIYLSQPRRIAAYNVADRMQHELDEALGTERADSMVGFRTAEKSTVKPQTRIEVLTDGIQTLRQLNDYAPDAPEEGIVYIIDEVHEYNTNIELAIALIDRVVAKNPNIHFVLMSATMDAPSLASFIAKGTGKVPPIIEVPGRTYGIEKIERPGSTVVEETVKMALELAEQETPNKTIQVFVPGKREISDTIDALREKLAGTPARDALMLPLHAKLSQYEQSKVTEECDKLRIIVTTNVAQTSLTIPNTSGVVDSGLERHVEFDEEDVEGLGVYPISQADCDQRAGRAGRICPGTYVLTRYDKYFDFEPYAKREKYPTPEILRTSTDRTVLRTAAVDIDLADLRLYHPLKPSKIDDAKERLYRLGALDQKGRVTGMGIRMNEFPVRPSSARMLIEASSYPPTVKAQLSAIVASLEVGGLQYFSHDTGREWQELTSEKSSDLLAQLDLFIASQNMSYKAIARYDLDVKNVQRARELHQKIVRRSDAREGEVLPPNPSDRQLILRSIYAGMLDGVYKHAGDGNYERMSQWADGVPRELSNRSVVRQMKPRPELIVGTPWRVEYFKHGKPRVRPIIEGVTVVENPRILGEIATSHMLSWYPVRRIWRAGKLVEVMRQRFNDVVELGNEKEVEASDTPENRAFVAAHVLKNSGPAQSGLRAIKKELEELQHLTKRPIRRMTDEFLRALVGRALEEGVLDESYVDNKLRMIAEQKGINRQAYVDDETKRDILDNAPHSIEVGNLAVDLRYRNGDPIASGRNIAAIDTSIEDVRIGDGRQVLFRVGRELLPLAAARAALMAAVPSA